eukprot:snap_masked-scaffold78_size404448-processed-gene-2.3 protein:Tk10213 transcript:snap_masked-scaffold78_size404448-processed-gene-2.3-mRNA-1 annotation:"b-cell lymphoma 3-encoded protein"
MKENPTPMTESEESDQSMPSAAQVEEERSSGSAMELRRYRKLTAKKRILEKLKHQSAKDVKLDSISDEPLAKTSKTDENMCKKRKMSPERSSDKDHQPDSAEIVDISENNTMTLEQFTDIVLASEGLSGPLRSKPVVLSPRQPPGLLHHLPQQQGQVPRGVLSSSVVVSVKPRMSPSPALANVILPPNKPPNISRMVEEWISKMPSTTSEGGVIKSEALNLSTKPVISRTTQVYLRPIPTPPKLAMSSGSNGQAALSSSGSGGQDRFLHRQPSVDRTRTPPHPVPSHQYSPNNQSSSPKLVVQPPKLSPPRLEIKRVDKAASSSLPLRKVGRASPLEHSVHLDSIKARALRDVQMAHTKDVHGNYPIHVSVLMRKPDLVRRYCCILQVLESSIDIMNEDQMTPLHLAVQENSMEVVEILLAFGADPGVNDRRGNTSFHVATVNKCPTTLRLLVKHIRGKDCINRLNEFGITPLHIATLNGDSASAEVLTKHGADPSIPDAIQGLTPLSMAKQGQIVEMLILVLKSGFFAITSLSLLAQRAQGTAFLAIPNELHALNYGKPLLKSSDGFGQDEQNQNIVLLLIQCGRHLLQ